ncbi:hypothetical protein AMK21_23285 [Streptomyces sp. CB00316]|uniref:hypothetical protein n=1 Tax=unclassified Streptomyces TaxID=2593676 RepID=UPI00093D1998|nr:hypothetical protein [Streptomyces sp. CB00316]OKJ17832.1 hypothetical protein AMK21_23285 [Streptomyces sp. CB00316]
MQRTRFTTKLLAGVAVTAVSGCVSVDPQEAAPRQPPRAESARPAQDVFPQVVQPPGREALEAVVEPSPSPGRPASPAPPSPSQARRAGPPPAPRALERAVPPPRRTPPRQVPVIPPGVLPALPQARGGGLHDVCALGRGYGGWPAGSREARICEETYGR